jgi:hypothetical protein
LRHPCEKHGRADDRRSTRSTDRSELLSGAAGDNLATRMTFSQIAFGTGASPALTEGSDVKKIFIRGVDIDLYKNR